MGGGGEVLFLAHLLLMVSYCDGSSSGVRRKLFLLTISPEPLVHISNVPHGALL